MRYTWIGVCICFIVCFLGALGVGRYMTPVLDIHADPRLYVYDRHQRLINSLGDNPYLSTSYTHIDQIPVFLVQMIVYREDRRFYHHYGIDIRALVRVLYDGYRHARISQGASTIDQQLVKLILGHHERSVLHKIIEQWYALWINTRYSKDEILLAYINRLEFGSLTRGLAMACQYFYRNDCHNLSQDQMIYLWSKTRFPSREDMSQYAHRFAVRLAQDHPEWYVLTDDRAAYRSGLKPHNNLDTKIAYPHLTHYILNRYHQFQGYDDSIVKISGNHIESSLDLDLIDRIQDILKQYKPYLATLQTHDVCIVTMQDAMIRSLNILRDWQDPQGGMVNPCTSPRQVGSAIKPFVYAWAMKHLLYTGGTQILDQPLSFALDHGGNYEPKNFDLKYHGRVSIGQALGSSLNIPAVYLLDQLGIDHMRAGLRLIAQSVGTDMQFEQNPMQYGLSLALGSIEISPLDFTRMYQIFTHSYPALGGYTDALQEVKHILSDNNVRLISFPLQNRFDIPDTRVKSGTSRHFVDGWTCGGVGAYTICIWTGNYNAKPSRDSGYNTAGVLRHALADHLLAHEKDRKTLKYTWRG